MLLKIFLLICLFLIKFVIQPTTCALPNNIQNLELDDVTSLWDKLPSLIDKIKEAVSRFRCPKGWKRLGGSCYYFSNSTSTSTHVNHTCNHLHSNLSNLMQIRNAVELFYAAHVLSRNNLTSLMIDIDLNLLKGRNISEMLMNDQGRWKRMKEKFQEVRVKYQKLKQRVIDGLSSTGLRILRRTKKVKELPSKQEFNSDEVSSDEYMEYEYYNKESNGTNFTSPNDATNNTSSIINHDEYEYEDLDSSDESDEFEQINNTRGICDEIHWNVLIDNHHNSSTYILTKYNMSDKIVCSLSDVQLQTKYHHVCEYVLDYCFANIMCGKHGRCENTLAGFKCSCSFLYGGLLCEKISENGQEIIISIGIIIIMILLSIKLIRACLWFIVISLIRSCKKHCKQQKTKKVDAPDESEHLVTSDRPDNDHQMIDAVHPQQRRQTLVQGIMEFFQDIKQCITLPHTSNPLLIPIKRNLVRNIWVGVLSILFLSLLFVITTIIYYTSFGYNLLNDEEDFSINDTIRLVTECAHISDYRRGNLTFAPCACALILIFSWLIKRETLCLNMCDGRPGLIPPIEPFRTGNRFTTATVFGILAFEVLKIFEELLFSTGQPLEHGVLRELLVKIALVIVVGLRYYPVLASLQLRNIVARFFACLYIIFNIIYTIVREGSCMGYLPLSGQYTALEEAKLRKELGSWFIIYGLIKNIPHFFFLSYIGAELCVRFAYDSIYVPKKKKQSIWLAPIVQLDESEFAKYYVTKLFRRRDPRFNMITRKNTNPNDLVDYEHELELQNKANQSCFIKLVNYFYHSDDDFHFTTMAMCTYTVAVVFLYYLACTFVFLYTTRTTGHGAFLKFYFESTFNVDLGAFSFKTEIIVSAVLTVTLYGSQLFIGMQNYKKHKLQLYKGVCVDLPSLAKNFKPSEIASNSVHYSGFLVGYMAWGFVICFHLVLLILMGIRVLSLQIRHIEIALGIIVPILIIYLLKILSMTSAGKFLFIRKSDNKLNLRSRKTYAVFVYFSFFADCFLGIASCIIRLIKATFLNVIYMARLDWSFLGRPLEKFDIGFAAYVSYLYMEVTHTNPVMLAFCYSLYDDIVQRRPKHCYADECCIAPGELDDKNDVESPGQDRRQSNSRNLSYNSPKVIYRRPEKNNESIEDKRHLNEDESVSKRRSQIEMKRRSQEFPLTEMMFTSESPKSSIVSTKESQKNSTRKTKQQQPNVVNEEKQSNTSTTIKDVPQQQPPSGPGPEVPPRDDLPSEHYTSDDDDDDEGLKPKSFCTVGNLIPKPRPRLKSPTQSSKINTDNHTDKDEEISKRKELIKKKNSKKRKKDISKSKMSPKEEEEDSGRVIKTSDTIKKLIPLEQPVLDSRKTKDQSSSEDGAMQSSKHPKGATSISVHTIDRKTPKISEKIRNTKLKKTTDKNPYETVLSEEERVTQVTTFHSLPSNNLATNLTDSYPFQTSSSHELHHSTPPLLPRNDDNANDDSSHYSEITDDTTRSGVSNLSYSKLGLPEASSRHSDKEKRGNDDTNVDTDEEEEENAHLLKSRPAFLPMEPIAASTVSPSNISETDAEIARIKRRKRLRFRWHFLYTMLRNYHLFDLRKGMQGRLTQLHLQRSNLYDEQNFIAATTTMEAAEPTRLVVDSGVPEAEAQRCFESSELDIPALPERQRQRQRPPPPARFFSVPISVSYDCPSSPAERYIATRAQMLYDANRPQPNTPNVPSVSRVPTTVSGYMQQVQPTMATTFSDQSLRFQALTDITVESTSERNVKLRGKQATTHLTTRALQQEPMTPSLFQPASVSNQSTADYPLVTSSIMNSPTYCTQMSHDQYMHTWRQEQVEKIQKKQRHCYVYGLSPQPAPVDRVSSATILTPQILSTTTKQQQGPPTSDAGRTPRQPTISPFPFLTTSSRVRSTPASVTSDNQSTTRNKVLNTNRPQQGVPSPPQRMDRLDEDPQETSNANKSSKTTSALIQRKGSQSSTTDLTEI